MLIESKRIVLRNYQDSDIADLVEGLNNLNVAKWLAGVPFPYTEESAKFFLNMVKNEDESKKISLAIVLKEDNNKKYYNEKRLVIDLKLLVFYYII